MASSARATALRRPPLEGRAVEGGRVSLMPAAPAQRVSLRAPSASLGPLSRALGLTLPARPKTSAVEGTRVALWLGPDEWLLIEEGEVDLAADCAASDALHSAVDVSHRNTAILVSGPAAADVINAGCPQDLSDAAFPPGACSRTVLGKIEVVLYRPGPAAFRIECWRSFSDYAFSFLEEAARGA